MPESDSNTARTIVKIVLSLTTVVICLIFGAGGGCLTSIVMAKRSRHTDQSWLGVAIGMTLVGAFIGLIVGIVLVIRLWRLSRE